MDGVARRTMSTATPSSRAMNISFRTAVVTLLTIASALPAGAQLAGDWPAYGRDGFGGRYSPLAKSTVATSALTIAWTYRTGDTAHTNKPTKFEATPVVVDGVMYLSTPFGRPSRSTRRRVASCGRTRAAATMAATGVTLPAGVCRTGSIRPRRPADAADAGSFSARTSAHHRPRRSHRRCLRGLR